MICLRKPGGPEVRLTVKGHSGSGVKGEDVVCAAISSLLLTMLGGMEEEFGAKVCGTLEDGDCDVTITVPVEQAEPFRRTANIFEYGFRRLSETYPQFVRMN